MDQLEMLKEVIEKDRQVRLVEDRVYSTLADKDGPKKYDNKAVVYDAIVGSRLYNDMIWGASVQNYRSFAADAINSHPEGRILDAGCGSLLFTSPSYVISKRLIIAFDQSLDMLRRARNRLTKLSGPNGNRIILLQANLEDLPFRERSFQTILSMNVLHHYLDAASLVSKLATLLRPNGQIFLTSLVMNNRWIGDQYLRFLHSTGWLATPRQNAELRNLLEDALEKGISFWTEGNMAYASTCQVRRF